MRTSAKRLLLILGSFGLLMTTLYLYINLLLPSYNGANGVQELRGERESKKAIVENEAKAEAVIGSLIETYKSKGLSKISDTFSLILPAKPDIPTLLNQLDGISRIDNMTIDSTAFNFLALKASKGTLIKPIGTVQMTLALHGKYQDLRAFVNDLETNIRLIDINSLKIDGGGVPNKDIFNYNLEAYAYYQSD